ncbi:sn-glycerol-1-phosphate dehydrogenase [Paenibacillus lemnae]|uniref:sn-glycerol-1-phosphate dehydrogenase n=1 Tax=Paenibacillus lemnae TaxID=1330551 RepID=A0A848MB14_PAELE|nr:sn-glycerol-1-phosphate dehydrogenase [Paenibacillus lemnae]NMO97350.1 sn-glycerol-1-phosphate dehydrogenase [Paenibacillus lemnae]
MSRILEEIRQRARESGIDPGGLDDIDVIRTGSGVLSELPGYLKDKGIQNILMITDKDTYECAGQRVEVMLKPVFAGVHLTMLKEDTKGDVLADEPSLLQVILDIQKHAPQIVLAVGSGTVHDITRYAAYTAGLSFVAVPTASSVDGFTSKGAPIIIRGEKITVQSIGPSAVFADTDILTKAPAALAAAGFGDMLGKYTSLFDWKFGSIAAGEPYMELAADLTRSALQNCVDHVGQIASRSEEGIHILTEALIQSGLAMLLCGQSHPASGAEHHVSHYWEMEYIRMGKKQLLHGAKVGAACVEISRLYQRLAAEGPDPWSYEASAGSGETGKAASVYVHWNDIASELARLPDSGTLSDLLRKVGGPASPKELGISHDLLERSMKDAHRIRMNRYTMLRANNERNREQTWSLHSASGK